MRPDKDQSKPTAYLRLSDACYEVIRNCQTEIPTLAGERVLLLDAIARNIIQIVKRNKPVCIAFITDSNARRSLMAEIWGLMLNRFHNFRMLHIRSAGFNPSGMHTSAWSVCDLHGLPVVLNEAATPPSFDIFLDVTHTADRIYAKTMDKIGFPRTQTIAVALSPEAHIHLANTPGFHTRNLIYPDLHESGAGDSMDEHLNLFRTIGVELCYLFHKLQELAPRRYINEQLRWKLDKETSKLIRKLDTANIFEESEIWQTLKTVKLNWPMYANRLYGQLNTRRGRYRLLSFVHTMPYDENLEELAIQAISDKYIDLRTYGFEILAVGQNKARLPQIRAKMIDKSQKTRFEATLCAKAIEKEDPNIFNVHELSWLDRWLHRIHDKRISRKYIPPDPAPPIFK